MQFSSEVFPGHGAGEGLGGAQCPHGLPGGGKSPDSQQLVLSPQRMKSTESTRLMAESSLREELESRWQKLHELTEERLRALWAYHEVGGPGWPEGGGDVVGAKAQDHFCHSRRRRVTCWSSAGAWTKL